MTEPTRIANLIDTLTQELQPVGRLRAPLLRAALWLGVVAAVAAVMAGIADLTALGRRLLVAPDMWLAVVGSILTAVAATIAAFQLSLPDRSARWAWLPLPAALLWVGASGAGCFRTAWTGGEGFRHSLDCLVFVIVVSLPLSILLTVMLRRGYALRPGLVAIVGGLASAAAAATLLNFFHPFDAIVTDLLVHVGAIALVVAVNGIFGGRLLQAAHR